MGESIHQIWVKFYVLSEEPLPGTSTDEPDSVPQEEVLYDCVICNQSTPSTAEKTVGLVVLLQASSGKSEKSKVAVASPFKNELPHGKNSNLHMRKQRCRSVSW